MNPVEGKRHHFHSVVLVCVLSATFYAALFDGGSPALTADTLDMTANASQPPAGMLDTATRITTTSPLDVLRSTTLGLPIRHPSVSTSFAAPEPTPEPTATPRPTRKELCAPSASQLYCIYTVQSGDTLSDIATEFGIVGTQGVTAGDILVQSNKPIVSRSDEIVTGQKIRIPAVDGIIHTGFTAQTIEQVATSYGVSAGSIRAVALNGVAGANLLGIGQEIIVPDPLHLPSNPAAASGPDDALPAGPTETAEPEPTATATPRLVTPTSTPEPQPTTAAAAEPPPIETPTPVPPTATATRRPSTATPTPRLPASRTGFIWPAAGPISSYFGPSHPLGIDIDFYADPNQPVRAAAAGTVAFAGGDVCCSYGLHVIIEHDNGFSTLYAHLSAIAVRAGQRVSQGQVIGAGGRTGYATGNHLHFEIRQGEAVVNPLTYLP